MNMNVRKESVWFYPSLRLGPWFDYAHHERILTNFKTLIFRVNPNTFVCTLYFLGCCLFLYGTTTSAQRLVIMLDPAGDTQYTGRHIDDHFERSLTLQCAESVKKALEARFPTIQVVLTRLSGEAMQPLQRANFANRLNINLYFSINFYQECATKPEFFIYTYTDNPFTTSRAALRAGPVLSFYPYDQAHHMHEQQTIHIAQVMYEYLNTAYQASCAIRGVYHVPFKPLMGIIAPAIACEIGLKHATDWHIYADMVTNLITELIARQTIT
jgi:N-acetylmuramoyl-L-alanine amidase